MIAAELCRKPLRQPVDPDFRPYYEEILRGNLNAISAYDSSVSEDPAGSFHEFIGRLFRLQPERVVKEVRALILEQGELSDSIIYDSWYQYLSTACASVRHFIRGEYDKNSSLTREQLWRKYIALIALNPTNEKIVRTLERDTGLSVKGQLEALFALRLEHLSGNPLRLRLRLVVPKEVFLKLAETNKRSDAQAERDGRFRERTFRSTPSKIARDYAALVSGVSVSTVTHGRK